ncbi:MAG: riboflavin synthase [Polyangiaceae bacterium]|nr:riboflavin synthase [Polyangiaceae bacterium]
MFTGLVEQVGRILANGPCGQGHRLSVAAQFDRLVAGESVAVNGACVTVVRVSETSFEADVSLETLGSTTLGRLHSGAPVHLERALRLEDRLGGHLVSGHVDGVAVVQRVERVGEAVRVTLRAPSGLLPYLARKGAVALDGVSLTINEVSNSSFNVMLVPFTREHTSFSRLGPGSELNIEADMLARYVVSYLEQRAGTRATSPARSEDADAGLLEALKRAGMA